MLFNAFSVRPTAVKPALVPSSTIPTVPDAGWVVPSNSTGCVIVGNGDSAKWSGRRCFGSAIARHICEICPWMLWAMVLPYRFVVLPTVKIP